MSYLLRIAPYRLRIAPYLLRIAPLLRMTSYMTIYKLGIGVEAIYSSGTMRKRERGSHGV